MDRLDPTLAPPHRVRALVEQLAATAGAETTIGRRPERRDLLSIPLPLLSVQVAGRSGAPGRPTDAAPADLELLDQLGSGGMGVVHAARQRALGRDVAIKRPHEGDATPETEIALLAEARTMGALEHPNIVPVHALGRDRGGVPLLVMKRIEGVAWRELLRRSDHAMWSRLGAARERGLAFHVEVLMHVCNALHFAHSRGVLHRDVKPDNVMIGAFGEVYLLDWGIARELEATEPSGVVGTPVYMAPEMLLEPESADTRTDVYLLGATLHELLVGRPLHDRPSLPEVLHAVLSPEPFVYPESAPADLVALVRAATSTDRDARPASSVAFREALAAHLTHRASHELAASAAAKRALAEQRASAEGLGSVDVGVLLAESRFGFEQSLREWRDNEVAQGGLQQCLERTIERELGLRNGTAARALLLSLPSPRAALEAGVVALEAELEAARARELAHVARAKDMDASVAARPRLLLLGGFLIVGGLLSFGAYLDEQESGRAMSTADTLWLDGGIATFVLGSLAIFRRRLLTNAYNRALWGLWVLAIVGNFVFDAFLGTHGVGSRTGTVLDFILLGVVFAAGAITLNRGLAWLSLTFWAAALVGGLAPTLATAAATLALVVALAISMEQTRRSGLTTSKTDAAA